MMNKTLVSVALFLFCIVAVEGISASRLYVDEQGRFSFSFTRDWRKVEDTGKGIEGHFVVVIDGKAAAEVIISSEKPDHEMTIDQYLSREKEGVKNLEGMTPINESKNFKIGGYPAAWMLVNLIEKDAIGETSLHKLSQYFIKKDDSFWGITIITSDEYRDLITEIMRTTVRSFEFSTGGKGALESLVDGKINVIFDPLKRYTISVPENWYVLPEDNADIAIESDAGKLFFFSMPVDDKSLTVKKAATDLVIKYETLEKCHVTEDYAVDIGTEKGHLINYQGEESGQKRHVQLSVLLKEGTAFYSYFKGTPDDWADNREVITGIQRTFSFVKPRELAKKDKEDISIPEFLKHPDADTLKDDESTEIVITIPEWAGPGISEKLLWEPISRDNIPK